MNRVPPNRALIARYLALVLTALVILSGAALWGPWPNPPPVPAPPPRPVLPAPPTTAPSPAPTQAALPSALPTRLPASPVPPPAPPPDFGLSAAPPPTDVPPTEAPPTEPPPTEAPPQPTSAPAKAAPAVKSGKAAPGHSVTVYAPQSNRITHIYSPDVQLDTKVIEVYVVKGEWQVADYAAGHHAGSALPGEGSNIVITGHNNWRGEVFRYLEFMHVGNTVVLTTADGQEHRYVVTQIQKLLEKGVDNATAMAHAAVMDPTPSERLTLITCWPYTTYDHRLIIFANPVP